MTATRSTPHVARPTRFALVILGTGAITGLHLGLLHLFLWKKPLAPLVFVLGALVFSAGSFGLQQWVFPRLPGRSAPGRLVVQTAIALLVSLTLSLFTLWVGGHFIEVPPLFGVPSGAAEVVTITPEMRLNGVWFYLLLPVVPSVLMTMLGYYNLWRPIHALETRHRELAELAAAAQLAALRAQINPHFLFNSLNSIAQLIHVDPDKAEVCVERLAEIFRYMLRRSEQEFVPLAEELAVADAYLEIEQARFGPRLQVDRHIDAASLRVRIPSLILQPLVENAVKHGLARKVGTGTVRIHASTADGFLTLTVDDDGVGMSGTTLAAVFDQGVGLGNLRARLERIYGRAHVPAITSTPGQGTSIRLLLPLEAA
jgi:signal transduction histidine kinase